ncbi:trypsin delta-like [Folsomia candida]|uniref:trypsin delta-like n=1 Tax=Folsomia candida TaxID=158441 RepID=UPI001604EAB5|nr:trypsin delta-like [Folsomia candida]
MFYGTAGNYGGDGNYEPDDNYHGFEGQPDWSDFSESGNIQSHGDRVYGGWFAKNGQWPFVVEVYVSGASCTGSLYDVNTIITAAHCVVSEKNVVSTADSVRIYAGSVVHGKGVHRYVESVNPHPKYKPHLGTYLYDIAIIKVTAPYNLSDTIRPIPIKQGVSLPVNTRCIITGFGAITGKPGEAEHNLTYANMRIRSNKLCVDTYGASDYKSAITICAGGLGTSMCYGDSGGPLHCPNPNGHGRVLFGVVSFSYDGDDKNKPCNSPYPGVFVRVPAFHRWIKNCAAGNCRLPTG